MRLNITSRDAMQLSNILYRKERASSVISKCEGNDNTSSLDWWQEHDRIERPFTPRHRAGIGVYLALTSQSLAPEYIPRSFFSRFDFIDSQTSRPDKGIIKCLLEANAIEPIVISGELAFRIR